jgi:hypothetical protein
MMSIVRRSPFFGVPTHVDVGGHSGTICRFTKASLAIPAGIRWVLGSHCWV